MSKLSRVGKSLKRQLDVKKLPNVLSEIIKSGNASTGPPLGPILGQRGIPIAKFASEFNDKTKDMIHGIPIPTKITIDGKKYKIELSSPDSEYLLRQAAGIKEMERDIPEGSETVGQITHKHLYEIAKVKIQDEYYKIRDYTMEQMCEELSLLSWKNNIEIVRSIDPEQYHSFLLDVEAKEEEFLEEKRQKELEMRKKMKLQ